MLRREGSVNEIKGEVPILYISSYIHSPFNNDTDREYLYRSVKCSEISA